MRECEHGDCVYYCEFVREDASHNDPALALYSAITYIGGYAVVTGTVGVDQDDNDVHTITVICLANRTVGEVRDTAVAEGRIMFHRLIGPYEAAEDMHVSTCMGLREGMLELSS